MQRYLSSEESLMTNKEKIFALTARAYMLELKGNFKTGKKDKNYSIGCNNVEDQKDIYICMKRFMAVTKERSEG